jgi:hypothetical protein
MPDAVAVDPPAQALATPEPEAEPEVDASQLQAPEPQAEDAEAQDAQTQTLAQDVQAADLQAQDQPEQIAAFAAGIELPPAAAPGHGQPTGEVERPADAASPSADDTILLASDDTFARDASPITIDPNKIANLQSVLDALDRARARTSEAPAVAGPRPLVGPGGVIDTAVAGVASAVAAPVASSTPARRPSAAPTPGASASASALARSNAAPTPRLPSAVPPALQMLRVRVGQPEASDGSKSAAETTTVRVRVAPEQPRLMGLYAGRSISTDFLSLGLLVAGLAGVGVFSRPTRDGRRRFWFGPRRA